MSDHQIMSGSCHCGAIAFDLEWPERQLVPSRACSCSFCGARGAVWTSHPDARLSIRIQAEKLSRPAR